MTRARYVSNPQAIDIPLTVSANLTANAVITVGNSSVNSVITSNTYSVGSNVSLSTSRLFLGNSTVNSVLTASTLDVGANVNLSTVGLNVGSNTVNAYINSTSFAIGNSTVNTAITSTTITSTALLSIGNTNVTGTANVSTGINVGANVNLSTSQINVGNSTVNTAITSTNITTPSANITSSGAEFVQAAGTETFKISRTTFNSGQNLSILANSSGNFLYFNSTTSNAKQGFLDITNGSNTTHDSSLNLRVLGVTKLKANSTIVNVSSDLTINGTANVDTAINVGANVSANTTALRVGNSTVNTVITSTTITSNAVLSIGNTNITGTANVSTGINVGANVISNTTAYFVGNSTVNTVITSTSLSTNGITVSGGTANGVAYLNSSKVLTTGSALTFDGTTLTNTRNTTDGSASTLTLNNSGATGSYATLNLNAGSVTYQQFSDAAGNAIGTAGAMLRTTSNHPLIWGTNNTERMRLDSSGNLLATGGFIPTNTSRLVVRGYSAISYNNTFSTANATVQIISDEMSVNQWYPTVNITMVRQSLTTGANAFGGIGFSTIDDSNNSGMYDAGRIAIVNDTGSAVASGTSMAFYTQVGSSNTVNAAIERMRIDSSGNVGVGLSNPGAPLQVRKSNSVSGRNLVTWVGGASTWSSGASEELGVGYNGIRSVYTGGDNWALTFTSGTSSQFAAVTQPERMRIAANGNVGIGTASPAYLLDVSGHTKSTYLNNGSYISGYLYHDMSYPQCYSNYYSVNIGTMDGSSGIIEIIVWGTHRSGDACGDNYYKRFIMRVGDMGIRTIREYSSGSDNVRTNFIGFTDTYYSWASNSSWPKTLKIVTAPSNCGCDFQYWFQVRASYECFTPNFSYSQTNNGTTNPAIGT